MSNTDYHEYTYDGPVKEFDRIVCNRWVAKTYAPTAKKAQSNLAFQFKKEFNRASSAKITLPGEIIRLNGGERAS